MPIHQLLLLILINRFQASVTVRFNRFGLCADHILKYAMIWIRRAQRPALLISDLLKVKLKPDTCRPSAARRAKGGRPKPHYSATLAPQTTNSHKNEASSMISQAFLICFVDVFPKRMPMKGLSTSSPL